MLGFSLSRLTRVPEHESLPVQDVHAPSVREAAADRQSKRALPARDQCAGLWRAARRRREDRTGRAADRPGRRPTGGRPDGLRGGWAGSPSLSGSVGRHVLGRGETLCERCRTVRRTWTPSMDWSHKQTRR
jgi:hypothetical protein